MQITTMFLSVMNYQIHLCQDLKSSQYKLKTTLLKSVMMKLLWNLSLMIAPETYAVVIDSQCDDGPSDIDGYSEFNTSTITQTLLTNPETNQTQSLGLYSVEYEVY